MLLSLDGTLVVQLINFLIFLVVLNAIFLKPVGEAIAKRRAYIDGVARDIQVIRKLDAGLDRKAVECVKTWRFRPASRNGQPVTAFASVEVKFRLR